MALPRFFFSIFLTSLLFMFIFPSRSSAEYAGIKIISPPSPQAGLYQAKIPEFREIKVTSPETPLGSHQIKVPEYHGTKPSNTAEPPKDGHHRVKIPKVTLSVYYETLCPYSAAFIKNDLARLFEDDLIDIVDLKLVPWGNAHFSGDNKTVICQHGPDECYLNSIEACAINIWPEAKKYFKFIHCVESRAFEHKQLGEHTWRSCCQELGLSPKSVSACYKSHHGRELLLRYADETSRLNPPHTFVPWVVVNNFPIYNDFKNFVYHVCKAYRGHLRLRACEPFSNKINLDGAGNPEPAGNDTESEKIPVHHHAKLRGCSVTGMELPA